MLSRSKWLAVAGLAGIITAVLLLTANSSALVGYPWLEPNPLGLQKQANTAHIPPSWNGNIDCYLETGSICTVSTPYGSVSSSSTIRLTDSGIYLPITSQVDSRQHFLPVPGSDSFITYTTEPVYGLYLFFNYHLLSAIKLSGNGYQIIRPPDGRFQDEIGHLLAADYGSLSFSENGRWMVASVPNVAMVRVDLSTFAVRAFAPGFDYDIGLSPSPQTAISNDGRYAALASKDFGRLAIYDLSTCSDTPTIYGPFTCQSRNLQSFADKQIPGFISANNLRFLSDSLLGFYGTYEDGSGGQSAKFLLSSGNDYSHQQDYLALGDSYISGEGAFRYLPGTDTADNQCHVSAVSYPYLLGYDLDYDAYHSVACSGATTNDIVNSSDKYTGQAKPYTRKTDFKEDRISAILTGFEQGYIDQADFVKQYQPQAITISVGGNDIGFSDRLRSCLGAGTCYDTYEERLEYVREVNRAFPKLVDTYLKLKAAGPPDARLYVIGYPQIAKPDGDCAVNVMMNHDELVFAQQAIDYLNSVIQAAAAKAGVFYVDVQSAFYGHRLCEAKPGSVAMNGVSAGNDFPDRLGGPIGRESYHPNDFGHQLLENIVLQATHNLSLQMPEPQPSAAPPDEADLKILDAPHSGRPINLSEFEPRLAADSICQGASLGITLDGVMHALAPDSTMRAELHSAAISLGDFRTDANGDLSAWTVIPASILPGYHVLHLYGADVAGQPIDIYKTIYVAAAPSDSLGQLEISQASSESSLQSPPIPSGASFSLDSPESQTNQLVQDISTTQKQLEIVVSAEDDLSIPVWYYPTAGFGFLGLVSLSYVIRNRFS